jgi:uncharacterized protein (DUF1330 family)
VIVEGTWEPHTLVVLEFPDMGTLDRWCRSPEYAPVLGIRLQEATTHDVSVLGFPRPSVVPQT